MISQAVILAGGLGTRLLPLTEKIPKPMVEISGKPFLYWQLRYLHEQGVENVLLLVSHLGEVIRDHFAAHPLPGLHLSYCAEPAPLGTGGALKNAFAQLEEKFLLVNGDSFLALNLEPMIEDFHLCGWGASVATLVNTDLVPVPANIKSANGKVVEFKKGAGKEAGFTGVDAGIYILRRDLFVNSPAGKFDLETLWPDLIRAGTLGAFPVQQKFYDIGTPERLKAFEEHLHDYF